MKSVNIALLAAGVMMTGVQAAKAQTADEILEKHANAIGGLENWNKIKTLKSTGSMSQQGMEISVTRTVESGKGMRMDISVAGMSGFQIVTSNGGYSYMPFTGSTKVDTMKADQVKSQLPMLDIKSNQHLDYKTSASKAEYVGRDTINSAPCYKVKFTDKEGKETTEFFECATYYLVRTESKVMLKDEEQEIAVQYGNYKKFDEGVVLPMSMTPAGVEITWKNIEINKPVAENVFKPVVDKK